MTIENFDQMYVAELQELASAQRQLEEAHERMAQAARHPEVKALLSRHRDETKTQRERLETVLRAHRASPTAHTDQAMQALIGEADKMLDQLQGDALRDAGLVASAQKIAHYEIATFGTAAALAGQLRLPEEQRILHQCVEEERQADQALSRLAMVDLNPAAAVAG
ncbi:ferritin-like domain-containing protein [Marinibaculum pumilum]|uniref:Ferritin-like domain-containing protein n=1 Tax=Marinibaculum pumilum TaxID=1766165 RepID=A0ABV7L4Q1_9PROT